jgi:hypothetical protein
MGVSLECIVRRENHCFAFFQFNLVDPVLKEATTNLGSLRIKKYCNVTVLVLCCLAQAIQTSKMPLVTSMRKVEASSVHSSVNESLELLYFPTSGSKSTDDLRM